MFVNGQRWCTAGGEQRARGSFLILFNKNPGGEIRALVRHVEMHQCGHFMMTSVKVKSPAAKTENDTRWDKEQYPDFYYVKDGHYKIHLSGTYGGDGLTKSPDYYPGLWEQLHVVPKELENEFWHPAWQGHNSAGAEGPSFRNWAMENKRTLNKLRKIDES